MVTQDYKIRKPDAQELEQLLSYYCQRFNVPIEDATPIIENAYIAVFPEYITGTPGYVGKVIVVVYDGSPEFYETYIQRNGKLVLILQER
jgi:hypothetical protein